MGATFYFGGDGNVLDWVMVVQYYDCTPNTELYYFKMVNFTPVKLYTIKITNPKKEQGYLQGLITHSNRRE